MSSGFVCLMGIGIVFLGLICLVFICKIMSAIVALVKKNDKKDKSQKNVAEGKNTDLTVEEKRSIIAGICAVIAEEIGTDVNNIKVLSFTKI